MHRPHVVALSLGAVFPLAAAVPAQPFATRVVSVQTNNNAGGGIFQPGNALGAPHGGGSGSGSLDVHSLGTGGDLTLGLGVVMVDGPGADLLVAENPFAAGPGTVFAELAFVEVSSDGTIFARFPSRFYRGFGGAFAANTVGFCSGLAGQTPVWSHPARPAVDPFDVVEAGGDAFDLADLRDHPLVRAGAVDLDAITAVRLVDAVSGSSVDSRGRVILDPAGGSADIDALTVIHHAANRAADGPTVHLWIPTDGNLGLAIEDPDGLADLDPSSLRVALFGQPVDPSILFAVLTLRRLSATRVELGLGGPLPPGLLLQMAVSVKDRAGHRSGARRQRPID